MCERLPKRARSATARRSVRIRRERFDDEESVVITIGKSKVLVAKRIWHTQRLGIRLCATAIDGKLRFERERSWPCDAYEFGDMEDSPVVIRTISKNSRKKRKRTSSSRAAETAVEVVDVLESSFDDDSTSRASFESSKRTKSAVSDVSLLRLKQDEALRESLRADRKRSRDAKRKRVEEDARAERAKESRSNRLDYLTTRLVPEPTGQEPFIAVKLFFRDTSPSIRRFPPSATMDALFAFAESVDPTCLEHPYEIRAVHDATSVLDPRDVDLRDASLPHSFHRHSFRVHRLND